MLEFQGQGEWGVLRAIKSRGRDPFNFASITDNDLHPSMLAFQKRTSCVTYDDFESVFSCSIIITGCKLHTLIV